MCGSSSCSESPFFSHYFAASRTLRHAYASMRFLKQFYADFCDTCQDMPHWSTMPHGPELINLVSLQYFERRVRFAATWCMIIRSSEDVKVAGLPLLFPWHFSDSQSASGLECCPPFALCVRTKSESGSEILGAISECFS